MTRAPRPEPVAPPEPAVESSEPPVRRPAPAAAGAATWEVEQVPAGYVDV